MNTFVPLYLALQLSVLWPGIATHLQLAKVRAMEIREARRIEEIRRNNELLAIEMLVDLAEQMYFATSAYGVPYMNSTRHIVAGRISLARALLADRRGAPQTIDLSRQVGNTWPFDEQGKVKP